MEEEEEEEEHEHEHEEEGEHVTCEGATSYCDCAGDCQGSVLPSAEDLCSCAEAVTCCSAESSEETAAPTPAPTSAPTPAPTPVHEEHEEEHEHEHEEEHEEEEEGVTCPGATSFCDCDGDCQGSVLPSAEDLCSCAAAVTCCSTPGTSSSAAAHQYEVPITGGEEEEGPEAVGAGGDPHVTNLNGVKFDIMQVGTMNMVTISRAKNETSDLKIDVAANRVSGNCSAIYLQDSVISGKWLGGNYSKLAVKVVHWVPAWEALEVSLNDGTWRPVLSAKKGINFVTKVTSSQIQFTVHNISIRLSVGQNMRRVDQFKGYNFLNLEVRGLRKLNSNLYMAGLLVRD